MRERGEGGEAANCARATLKDLTEKTGRSFERLRMQRPSETRSCAGSTRRRTPRTRMPVTNACNQLSAAIRSSNGDSYGIGERLRIVCDRARRILIGGQRGGEREREERASRLSPEIEIDTDSKDGWNWTDPEVEVFIDQGRAKLGFVDGRWREERGEMGIVGSWREAIRGGDRDSRQITSG